MATRKIALCPVVRRRVRMGVAVLVVVALFTILRARNSGRRLPTVLRA